MKMGDPKFFFQIRFFLGIMSAIPNALLLYVIIREQSTIDQTILLLIILGFAFPLIFLIFEIIIYFNSQSIDRYWRINSAKEEARQWKKYVRDLTKEILSKKPYD